MLLTGMIEQIINENYDFLYSSGGPPRPLKARNIPFFIRSGYRLTQNTATVVAIHGKRELLDLINTLLNGPKISASYRVHDLGPFLLVSGKS